MPKVAKASLVPLSRSSQASAKKTREALELAFARLRNGNPRVVKKGTPVSPTSVAEEAGVRRETLYRSHEPVLTSIKKYTQKGPIEQLRQRREELREALEAARDLRELLERAQKAEEALARVNHRLTARISALEQDLALRDALIARLHEAQGASSANVYSLLRPEQK